MKKVLIFLCVLLMLVTSVGTAVADETEVKPNSTLVREANQLYKQCLSASGRESFQGFCGLMTSYQLWKLGINDELLIYDGNKQYDAYKNMTQTTGGFDVQAYGADKYTLETALNAITANGKKSVRNILVGFQWTSTEAGATYGHACIVNAIDDGVVYFTESFDYAMGRLEGQVITCTMDEFVNFFDGWTTFEGVIYFGQKQYASSCSHSPINTYLQLRFESNLRSQPCLIGENDCQRVRTLAAGEILRATAVYESGDGDLFYQIEEADFVGYVSANAVFQLKPETTREGWFLENGTWYCYQSGAPCTGWVTRIGVRYYLKADGSVTTGWAEIDGATRYFSATGALCRGWITTWEGTCYQTVDGVMAKGLQQLDGSTYFFGEDGFLLTGGTVTWEGITYSVGLDGTVTPTA